MNLEILFLGIAALAGIGGIWLAFIVTVEFYYIRRMEGKMTLVADRTKFLELLQILEKIDPDKAVETIARVMDLLQYLDIFDEEHLEARIVQASQFVHNTVDVAVRATLTGIGSILADPEKGVVAPIVNQIAGIAQSVAGVKSTADKAMSPKNQIGAAFAGAITNMFPGAGGQAAGALAGGVMNKRCSRCARAFPEDPTAGEGHTKRSRTCPTREPRNGQVVEATA